MRILHTSDWHLGKRLMERSLLEDQGVALEGLLDLLSRDPHDLLVVAGDVFDQSVPPEDAVKLLGRFLWKLRAVAPRLPAVLIAGNHDSATRLASNADLISHTGVHLRRDAEAVDRPVVVETAEGERAEVWAVPFLWPGSLASGDVVARTQVQALSFALERIQAAQERSCTQVLLAHCFAQGGLGSDSERVLVGQATAVEPELLAGFDYVALGHLHRPQQVGRNARYSGSLLPYSFSEVDDAKSVLSVIASPGVVHTATPIPLPRKRGLRRIAGTLAQLLEAPEFDECADDYLHITLTTPERSGQPMAALRRRFPHVLQLVNPVMPAGRSLQAMSRKSVEPGADLAADFEAFEKHLYGDDLSPDVRAGFERIRQDYEPKEQGL